MGVMRLADPHFFLTKSRKYVFTTQDLLPASYEYSPFYKVHASSISYAALRQLTVHVTIHEHDLGVKRYQVYHMCTRAKEGQQATLPPETPQS